MKRYRLCIVIVCATLLVSSCKTWMDVMYKDYNVCTDLEIYHNMDWSKNFYVVDSIPFDTTNYQVIYNEKAGLQYFYVSKKYLESHQKYDDYTLLKAKFSILQFCLSWDNYQREEQKDEIAPSFEPFYGTTNDPSWQTFHFSDPPTFLRVYIVRGDCFNFGTRMGLDTYKRAYHFPQTRANYKVVVPVWSNISFVPD